MFVLDETPFFLEVGLLIVDGHTEKWLLPRDLDAYGVIAKIHYCTLLIMGKVFCNVSDAAESPDNNLTL